MPTIKDVAKKANVSVATVSRVLNQTGYVNEETKKMVERAIKELNYIPNELARSLYKRESRIIGLIIPHLSTYFFGELIEAIEEYFAEDNYKIMIFNVREDLSQEDKIFNVLSQYNIDGLILITHLPKMDRYMDLDIPMISIDHRSKNSIPSISSDNVEGGRIAARHLLDCGATNILHVRGPSVLSTVQDRSEGFNEILEKHSLQTKRLDVDFRSPSLKQIQAFITEHSDADGIFCDSDILAITTMRALALNGKDVPGDVQVIGFDNTEMSELITPSLTTIEQNIDNLAKMAHDTLLQKIKKQSVEQNHITLPVKLINRESTIK